MRIMMGIVSLHPSYTPITNLLFLLICQWYPFIPKSFSAMTAPRLKGANKRSAFAPDVFIRRNNNCALLGLLEILTTHRTVVKMSNMKAILLVSTRITYSKSAFAELVLWRLTKPVEGSAHGFKYRLAYVVRGECVLRYDNEAGKGDHRHVGGIESTYTFTTPEQLIADFQRDIERWNDENRNS
jgi:hypothetical protein